MVDRQCKCCRAPFKARASDVKRGWGLFCSKSCKANHQEARTGQHQRRTDSERPTFSDAHLFSNEEHDCNKPL